MRFIVMAALLVGCTRPTAAPNELPRVQLAIQKAKLDPKRVRVFQLASNQVLLGEALAPTLAESDAAPNYRVVSFEGDAANEVLARASWAARVDASTLLAVEDGRLVLHRGNAARTLLENAAPDFAIDPSGKWIAAVTRKPELKLDTDLVMLPVEGGPTRVLAAFPGSSESRPIFTPDNRAVIFVSGKSGLASLWRVELASGVTTQLTNIGMRGGHGIPVGFVPPPSEMALAQWDGETLLYVASGQTIRVDTRGAR
ncbi:MAG: hypothetical protein JST54_34210 [Deltaproteobacteria bacterium]|nr:hypothetical protein [Deltaproteobacteria bacterium]